MRVTLERPDAITASAVSAREEISRAVAAQIRELDSTSDLRRVAEDVLPQLEKFLESPEEKRMRRVRKGVVTAAVGLGATLLMFLMSLAQHDLLPFIGVGLNAIFIGLGIVLNGFVFTVPRKKVPDHSSEGRAQKALDSQTSKAAFNGGELANHSTNELGPGDPVAVPASVTEHTTQHLKTKL